MSNCGKPSRRLNFFPSSYFLCILLGRKQWKSFVKTTTMSGIKFQRPTFGIITRRRRIIKGIGVRVVFFKAVSLFERILNRHHYKRFFWKHLKWTWWFFMYTFDLASLDIFIIIDKACSDKKAKWGGLHCFQFFFFECNSLWRFLGAGWILIW